MNGFALATVRGIDVRINWSVGVIGALIASSLANAALPDYAEGYSSGAYWLAAVIATIAFFGGLLGHEMAHAIVAQREGVSVSSVTLWLFGGVAKLDKPPTTPRAAMRIAAAGPAASVAIGAVALVVSLPFSGLVGAVLTWYGIINLALAAFNLLPAFPMDGGRIYQAWRWSRSGDEDDATERAAALGLLIGSGLVVLGALEALFGGFIGGLWLVLVGLFLREATRAEVRSLLIHRPLSTMPISQVMTAHPTTVDGATTIGEFAEALLFGGRHAAYPVVDASGSTTGLITLNSIRMVPRSMWTGTTITDHCTPIEDVLVVGPDDDVESVLRTMGTRADGRALVMDGTHLMGIVTPSDLTRLITVLDARMRPDVIAEPHPRSSGRDFPLRPDDQFRTIEI